MKNGKTFPFSFVNIDEPRYFAYRTPLPGCTIDWYWRLEAAPAGDAAAGGGPPLTPVAGAEGRVVAENLLQGNHQQPNYTGTPSVIFTIPPLAAVGLREEEATQQGRKFTVHTDEMTGWYSARRTNEQHTAFKVLVEDETEQILGAHLLGTHAEEVINLFGLAMRHGLRASDLKSMIYAYPTKASDISYMV